MHKFVWCITNPLLINIVIKCARPDIIIDRDIFNWFPLIRRYLVYLPKSVFMPYEEHLRIYGSAGTCLFDDFMAPTVMVSFDRLLELIK